MLPTSASPVATPILRSHFSMGVSRTPSSPEFSLKVEQRHEKALSRAEEPNRAFSQQGEQFSTLRPRLRVKMSGQKTGYRGFLGLCSPAIIDRRISGRLCIIPVAHSIISMDPSSTG